MISVVPATMEHARAIELRPGDAAEIAALGYSQVEGLSRSIARSVWADAYVAEDEVAAILGLGLTAMVGGLASLWLITGTPVDRHRKEFLRLTRERTARMLAEHGTLRCDVHADYRSAIRWLRWLGFSLAPARPRGLHGALFHGATLGATA
jgi:hypothetical protein